MMRHHHSAIRELDDAIERTEGTADVLRQRRYELEAARQGKEDGLLAAALLEHRPWPPDWTEDYGVADVWQAAYDESSTEWYLPQRKDK